MQVTHSLSLPSLESRGRHLAKDVDYDRRHPARPTSTFKGARKDICVTKGDSESRCLFPPSFLPLFISLISMAERGFVRLLSAADNGAEFFCFSTNFPLTIRPRRHGLFELRLVFQLRAKRHQGPRANESTYVQHGTKNYAKA